MISTPPRTGRLSFPTPHRAPGRLGVLLLVLLIGPALQARESRKGLIERVYREAAPAIVGVECIRETSRGKENYRGTGTIVDPAGLVLTSITVVPPEGREIRVAERGGGRHPVDSTNDRRPARLARHQPVSFVPACCGVT